jgi:hypothetical protein
MTAKSKQKWQVFKAKKNYYGIFEMYLIGSRLQIKLFSHFFSNCTLAEDKLPSEAEVRA